MPSQDPARQYKLYCQVDLPLGAALGSSTVYSRGMGSTTVFSMHNFAPSINKDTQCGETNSVKIGTCVRHSYFIMHKNDSFIHWVEKYLTTKACQWDVARKYMYLNRSSKQHQLLLTRGSRKVLSQDHQLIYQNLYERHLVVFCIDCTVKTCYYFLPMLTAMRYCEWMKGQQKVEIN